MNVNITSGDEQFNENENENDIYPKYVRHYNVRIDTYTNKPVERGRLNLLGGLLHDQDDHKRVTLEEFKRILQCPLLEPELNRKGSISLYKMAPPTRSGLELICAYLQTQCSPWSECRRRIMTLKENPYQKSEFTSSPYQVKLYRIINNELYYDWPWGQYQNDEPPVSMIEPIWAVLKRISNIGDSVFLMGEEISFMPFNIPMPAFSSSPKLASSELPWVWEKAFKYEKEKFKNYQNTTNAWISRIPKAVFYGSLTRIRQIFFDVASLRPDLFDAKWVGGIYTVPWNPDSEESRFESNDSRFNNDTLKQESAKMGYLQNLLKNHLSQGEPYDPSTYKFTVVLTGAGGSATADRLSSLLAHSGSVVLLQEHEFSYTFSKFLIPWVHYVPIAYSAADIIEKIEYLLEHDHIAEKIAINSRNFGVSHLRYEDYLCYVAEALNTVSNVTSVTDANIPYNATKTSLFSSYY